MRIVFLAPFAFAPKATVSARMLPMAAALVMRGHDVTILIPPYDNPTEGGATRVIDGVRLEHLGARGASPAALLALASQMARRAAALRPDVVHAFKPVGPGALAAAWLGGPFVVDNDDWEGRGGWLDANAYALPIRLALGVQEGWTLRRASAVTCASETLVARTAQLAPGAPTSMLPNGPAPSTRATAADAATRREALRERFGWTARRMVIYAGAIPAVHDMDIALRAFATCAARDPRLGWCVIATGAGLDGFRESAARSGVGDRFEWHPFIPHDTLIERLVAADIAVYPYRDTPINRAKCSGKVIDYMAAGLPMVIGDVGMNRVYARDGEHALLAPPGDADAFAASLTRLLADPAYAKTLGAAAQRRLWEAFAWPPRAPQLERVYASAARR